jgi:hypothetical protein
LLALTAVDNCGNLFAPIKLTGSQSRNGETKMSDPRRKNEIALMNRRHGGSGTALVVFLLGVLLVVGGLIWAGAKDPQTAVKDQQTTTGAAPGKTGAGSTR